MSSIRVSSKHVWTRTSSKTIAKWPSGNFLTSASFFGIMFALAGCHSERAVPSRCALCTTKYSYNTNQYCKTEISRLSEKVDMPCLLVMWIRWLVQNFWMRTKCMTIEKNTISWILIPLALITLLLLYIKAQLFSYSQHCFYSFLHFFKVIACPVPSTLLSRQYRLQHAYNEHDWTKESRKIYFLKGRSLFGFRNVYKWCDSR